MQNFHKTVQLFLFVWLVDFIVWLELGDSLFILLGNLDCAGLVFMFVYDLKVPAEYIPLV